MKAIIEEASPETARKMQQLALAEGALPIHLLKALFTKSSDNRLLMHAQLSKHLVGLWTTDFDEADQLLERIFVRLGPATHVTRITKHKLLTKAIIYSFIKAGGLAKVPEAGRPHSDLRRRSPSCKGQSSDGHLRCREEQGARDPPRGGKRPQASKAGSVENCGGGRRKDAQVHGGGEKVGRTSSGHRLATLEDENGRRRVAQDFNGPIQGLRRQQLLLWKPWLCCIQFESQQSKRREAHCLTNEARELEGGAELAFVLLSVQPRPLQAGPHLEFQGEP